MAMPWTPQNNLLPEGDIVALSQEPNQGLSQIFDLMEPCNLSGSMFAQNHNLLLSNWAQIL